VKCGRELLPSPPWYLRGPLSGFGPMPTCKTDLAECRAGLMRRIGLLPDICGQVSPTIGPGIPDVCRRPAGHEGAHTARPADPASMWWTDSTET
jgi:hypothetical protein